MTPGNANHGFHRPPTTGLTLIEVLAVVIIMSLAARTIVMVLGSADTHARHAMAIAAIRGMDGRGRLLAQTAGTSLVMRWDERSCRLTLHDRNQETIESHEAITPPVAIELQTTDNQPEISFDCRGQSIDYSVHVRTDHRTTRLSIGGLTGLVRLQEGAP